MAQAAPLSRPPPHKVGSAPGAAHEAPPAGLLPESGAAAEDAGPRRALSELLAQHEALSPALFERGQGAAGGAPTPTSPRRASPPPLGSGEPLCTAEICGGCVEVDISALAEAAECATAVAAVLLIPPRPCAMPAAAPPVPRLSSVAADARRMAAGGGPRLFPCGRTEAVAAAGAVRRLGAGPGSARRRAPMRLRPPPGLAPAAAAGWVAVALPGAGAVELIPLAPAPPPPLSPRRLQPPQPPGLAAWHAATDFFAGPEPRCIAAVCVAAGRPVKIRWAARLLGADAAGGEGRPFAEGAAAAGGPAGPARLEIRGAPGLWQVTVQGCLPDGSPAGRPLQCPADCRLEQAERVGAESWAADYTLHAEDHRVKVSESALPQAAAGPAPPACPSGSEDSGCRSADSRVAVDGSAAARARRPQGGLVTELKTSINAARRQFTPELLRGLRRLFHRHLTADWQGSESLRPCDVNASHELHVAQYGTRSFLRFADTYGEAVAIVFQSVTLQDSGAAPYDIRAAPPRQRRRRRPLVPLRAIALGEALEVLLGSRGPWWVPWRAFALLCILSAEQVAAQLVPLRAQYDAWAEQRGPPAQPADFYGLLRALNGGEYLPLDSLWKAFCPPPPDGGPEAAPAAPCFVDALLALLPRTQQIPVLGQCAEVHPNVHLKAYNRAVRKKVRLCLAMLASTLKAALGRYFAIMVAYALQRRSRRDAMARTCIEVQRRNDRLIILKHFRQLLAHHQWCLHYHDRVQKSKQLMWKTQSLTWKRYFEKVQKYACLKRKRKIVCLKLEKIRIVAHRDLARSLVLHRRYYGRWLTYAVQGTQRLMLHDLLAVSHTELLRVCFERLLKRGVKGISRRREGRVAALLVSTEQQHRRIRYGALYRHHLSRKVTRIQSLARRRRRRIIDGAERSRVDQQAITQEARVAARMIQRWWGWWRPGPGRIIWKWVTQREALEQEHSHAARMLQSCWRGALAVDFLGQARANDMQAQLAQAIEAQAQEGYVAAQLIQSSIRKRRACLARQRLALTRQAAWLEVDRTEQQAGLTVTAALRRCAAQRKCRRLRRARCVVMRLHLAMEFLYAARLQRWWLRRRAPCSARALLAASSASPAAPALLAFARALPAPSPVRGPG